MSVRAQELRRRIAAEIRAGGPMSFERFMERALYEPGLGYYTAGAERGPGADFRTSPLVGEVFARLIGAQIEDCWRRLGAPGDFRVVEFGAGGQALARGALRALGDSGAWPLGARYLAVDPPRAGLEERKQAAAEPEPAAVSAPEPATQEQALRALGEAPALVLSNEFLDALPVRRFVVRDGEAREVRVGLVPAAAGGEERFTDVEAEAADAEVTAALAALPALADGFQFEVGRRARAWMQAVGRALGRGYVLSLDYGYRRAERFRPERADGTVLAYHRHRVERDLYARVGEQDLTSHVDFDDLIEAGMEAGLEPLGLTDQMRFLTALARARGILEGEPSSAEAWRGRLAFKELIRPGGMGTAFRVLAQAKGAPAGTLLGLHDPFAR